MLLLLQMQQLTGCYHYYRCRGRELEGAGAGCACCLSDESALLYQKFHNSYCTCFIKSAQRSSGQDSMFPLQGARVYSLVRELRSRMPRGVSKKKKKVLRPRCWPWSAQEEGGPQPLPGQCQEGRWRPGGRGGSSVSCGIPAGLEADGP